MKIFIMFLLLLAMVLVLIATGSLAAPSTRIEVDCIVSNVERKMFTIKCDAPNPNQRCMLPKNKENEECKRTILDVPSENWNEFQAWHYETNNDPWHRPVKQLRPKLGQLLRASYVMGTFVPLKPCAVRGYEALQEYCKLRSYCRPPLTLATPEGCGLEPNEYIKSLQAEALRKKK